MENKDEIAELFREKLSGFEAEVRPELWTAVSSQIASGSALVSGGFTWITKSLLVLAAAGLVTGAIFIFNSNESKEKQVIKNTETQPEVIEKVPASPSPQIQNTNVSSNAEVKEQKWISSVYQTELPEKIEAGIKAVSIEASQKQESATVVAPVIVNEEVLTTKSDSPQKSVPAISTNTTDFSEQIAQQRNFSEQLSQLPNVFTPNNDGSNDLFEIKSEGLTDFQLVILNESNKVIFSSSDPAFVWDGTLNTGDPAPAGTYLYYLTAKDEKQQVISRSSLLKLIR